MINASESNLRTILGEKQSLGQQLLLRYAHPPFIITRPPPTTADTATAFCCSPSLSFDSCNIPTSARAGSCPSGGAPATVQVSAPGAAVGVNAPTGKRFELWK